MQQGGRSLRRVIACGCASACALTLGVAVPALGAQRTVQADSFTLQTPALKPGQIELITLSTRPTTVTGGDVLLAVRGLRAGDRLTVQRGRTDVSSAFTGSGSERRGRVGNLRLGINAIIATARSGRAKPRRVTLFVRNHSHTGPVISGPHQKPFVCQTEASGLGKPLDAKCTSRRQFDWYYRSTEDQGFKKLADPFAAYPDDTAMTTTSDGKRVPFVVRVESATINRGITRIAVIDDPRARGRGKPFTPASWNKHLTYAFGESCGVGYRQGSNQEKSVLGGVAITDVSGDTVFSTVYGLSDRLADGDTVAISTMTTFGVYCNPLVSAETLMMIKEHIVEAYGPVSRTISVGGSGGALQQYNAGNNFPGLLDGATPVATFTDIPSTAMTVVDCGLFIEYFGRASMSWSDAQKAAVAGHLTPRICVDWKDLFLPNLDPARGCSGVVPRDIRYDAQRNPKGVRCTLQDATANVWGRDPATGFAYRPYDNIGVQYGLGALRDGAISPDQFVELNTMIGGYDIDSRPVPQRSAMSEQTARRAHELGIVIGRGSLPRIPVIDLATYLDAVPVADIHDVIRPFQVRQRLRAQTGGDGQMTIWRGVSIPPDAAPAIGSWVDAIAKRNGRGVPAAVAAARPDAANDRCIVTTAGGRAQDGAIVGPLGTFTLGGGAPGAPTVPIGTNTEERQEAGGAGVCQQVFPAKSAPRMVAGGPLTDDIIKCQLKPVDAADYGGKLSAAQVTQMAAIFPTGVCDYGKPGVGVMKSITWPTIGSRSDGVNRATESRWTAVRSG